MYRVLRFGVKGSRFRVQCSEVSGLRLRFRILVRGFRL